MSVGGAHCLYNVLRIFVSYNTGTCGYTYTLEYIAWIPSFHLMIFFYSFLELLMCFQMCLLFVSDFINSHICSVVFQWLCLRHGDCVAVAIINIKRNVQVTLQYCLTESYILSISMCLMYYYRKINEYVSFWYFLFMRWAVESYIYKWNRDFSLKNYIYIHWLWILLGFFFYWNWL